MDMGARARHLYTDISHALACQVCLMMAGWYRHDESKANARASTMWTSMLSGRVPDLEMR